MSVETESSCGSLLDTFELELKHTIECETNDLAFQSSVRIYINKPQVVNKWLAGSSTLTRAQYRGADDVLAKIPLEYHKSIEYKEFIAKKSKKFQNVKYMIVQVPKRFVFIPLDIRKSDQLKNCSFCSAHCLELDSSKKSINIYIQPNFDDDLQDHYEWFDKVLLKKIAHWCTTIKTDKLLSCSNLSTLTFYPNMINDYVELYQELKDKYWQKFSARWLDLTNTDPKKFIHEDISIATYLVLVWRYLDVEMKKFVDLGNEKKESLWLIQILIPKFVLIRLRQWPFGLYSE
jgi:hypothetical protein